MRGPTSTPSPISGAGVRCFKRHAERAAPQGYKYDLVFLIGGRNSHGLIRDEVSRQRKELLSFIGDHSLIGRARKLVIN